MTRVMPCSTGRAFPPGFFGSLRTDWTTPRAIFEILHREFHFTLDACATAETTTCGAYLSEAQDALGCEWWDRTFCNPPYGKQLGKWIRKAWDEAQQGRTVVLLIPARTDTRWWHDYCLRGEIRFLKGRLAYDNGRRLRAPFPTAIVIFRGVTQ